MIIRNSPGVLQRVLGIALLKKETAPGIMVRIKSSCLMKVQQQRSMMTTAYSGIPSDGMLGIREKLDHWIPYCTTLTCHNNKNKPVHVEVGPFHSYEWQHGMNLMNYIINEGKSWPFYEEFNTIDSFRGYFLSHTAFVVRSIDEDDSSNRNVMGMFYIKPNYPGRCSHICNGGFITHPNYRNIGVGKLMGRVFLKAAKDLGYKSCYFNLVFKSNVSSIKLWESLGFQRVATLENAANLKGIDGLDTAYGYRYDLEQLDDNYLVKNDTTKTTAT